MDESFRTLCRKLPNLYSPTTTLRWLCELDCGSVVITMFEQKNVTNKRCVYPEGFFIKGFPNDSVMDMVIDKKTDKKTIITIYTDYLSQHLNMVINLKYPDVDVQNICRWTPGNI